MKNLVTVALSACLFAAGMVLHAQDRVVAVTNAEGQVARMEYEIGDKVSRMTRFDGTEVGYTQNAYGLLSAAYPSFTNTYSRLMDGSLLSATGPNGTIAYAYDKFGNVTEVATEQGGMTSTYDTAGNVTRRDFDFGSFECAYDQAGRVTGVTWNVGGLTMPFGYEYSQENGALAAVEYPNAVTRELGYDVMDRVAEIAWSGYDTADADSREYSYDNADNIVSISTADGATIDYAYDGIDRLAGESKHDAFGLAVRTDAYVYDACGNRTGRSFAQGGVAEAYENTFEADDRLAEWTRTDSGFGPDSVTNTVYLYAASGCTTGVVSYVADGTVRNVNYTWTDDYRLASISVDGTMVAEYAYDVFGSLVGVSTADELFEILVDGGHSLADVVVSPDGTKTPLRVYMRGPGVDSWLGFVDMTGATPVPYFYVTDHLGSVLAVVDANGNVVERYEYDAWGKVLSVTDANCQQLSRSAIGNRILWQGREYSWSTGLYYFRNRWYDPTIGRWISKDPIGIQGGINLYEFCKGNPIMGVDPDGCSFLPVVIDKLGKVNRTLNPCLSGYWFWHHTVRELLNDPLPETPPEGEDGWTELPPNKSIFHDNGDECPERKFVHRDGREAVYDGKTKRLITDSVYKGTYNFINPGDKDDCFVVRHLKNLGHGLYDVLPYIIMGN